MCGGKGYVESGLLNTDDLETILSLRIDEVLSIDLKWVQRSCGTDEGTHGGEQTSVRLEFWSVG